MVTSLSASEDNRALIAQVPAMIPALAKQMTDVKEISREVYKALINLAESEEICKERCARVRGRPLSSERVTELSSSRLHLLCRVSRVRSSDAQSQPHLHRHGMPSSQYSSLIAVAL